MEHTVGKRRLSETENHDKNFKDKFALKKNKKSNQALLLKKENSVDNTPVDFVSQHKISKQEKKDKKRKVNNDLDTSSPSKKLKQNEKLKKKPIKIEESLGEFREIGFVKLEKKDHQDEPSKESIVNEKNGIESISKKSKKKKNKKFKKTENSLMDFTYSSNNISLESLNKQKEKLLKQIKECNDNINSTAEVSGVKKNKKKKNKQKKKSPASNVSTSPKKIVDTNSPENESTDLIKLDSEKKFQSYKVISSKKKNSFLSKKDHRNVLRQQEGQYHFINTLSIEEMREKIAEILNREEKSKRAIRILRTLKKKLQVAEDALKNANSKEDSNILLSNQEQQKSGEESLGEQGEECDNNDQSFLHKKQVIKKEPFIKDAAGSYEKNKIESEVSPKKDKENSDHSKKIQNKTEQKSEKKQRYVLFVGNVSDETTTVDLKKHFLTKVSKVCDVRIPLQKETNTSRGFAYVEVENSTDFEKALSLHGSFLNNKPIRVEYTTNSKKIDKKEMIHKNKKLSAMRKAGKLAGSKKDSQKRTFRRNFKNNQRSSKR